MNCELLVEGAAVLSLDPEWRIFEPGYVAIKSGAIVGIGPGAEARRWEPARRLGGADSLVMPGFVNTHTHVSMAAFRGASEDVEDRLARFIFPLEKRLVKRDLVREAALFCLVEMAKSGTTTFADMYYFEDEVAAAAKRAGLRCLLGETIVDFAAPDAAEAYGGLDYGLRFIEDFRGDPLVTPCLAPHAPYTVDAEHLSLVARESARLGLPWMMHVAETLPEARRFGASHGSTVKYLDSIGALGPGLLAAHAIYVDDADVEILARRDVSIAHCPASNAKSGRSIAPVWKYREAGLRCGLATDGPISGNGMDMQGIVGLYPKLQKVLTGRRDLVTAREALRAATLGGAETLGMGALTGSLETGKRGDLIIVSIDDFNLRPVYDWYATAVYAMRPHNVRSVLVDGRLVVDEGRMTGIDEAECLERMRGISESCRGEIARILGERS